MSSEKLSLQDLYFGVGVVVTLAAPSQYSVSAIGHLAMLSFIFLPLSVFQNCLRDLSL